MNKELKEIALDLGKMNDLELSIYYEVAKEKMQNVSKIIDELNHLNHNEEEEYEKFYYKTVQDSVSEIIDLVITEMSMIEGELRCRLDDIINILISIERELKPYEVERLLRMLIKRY